ncbi:thioredoxin domain-containing protein [Paramagnetospirillum kuznetsovii]|uniref:Thioredoxin domain-containing protein n=1 Tax=Paramagnetospirillum kuznetsovii TaxID=2053833 RepID=A0A364P3H8_9PROT|nr:thioredoxin domain-containing protein [Paramagnetospirillum kuznetsovii]RAU23717.1 thioredoxin domain-containing protein [Paramagnetospirillum kuznetsovii]
MSHNRLALESSPYLLQHAHNPVHWWAWGTEALAEAKASGKPILLSVGYSACHWCHVMAHESFEDEGVAALMNDLFVNIKVDREERPDLDSLYQMALAMMGQQGGWPLTMFLTPDGEPFWGGTYFPPTARWGRAAFPDVLEGIAGTFRRDPDKITHNVAQMRRALDQLARSPGAMALEMEVLNKGAADILNSIDLDDGGTLGAPKFPQPGLFRYLWRAYLRTGDDRLRQAVTVTLDHICQGGIYDHLGGGFMRYSTDAEWLVPHFEKMLYDNAQLISLLCQVWKRTGSPLYRARVFESVGWLMREMMAEGGAFAAALDADSEGEEGLFYTWTAEQISALLDAETALRFGRLYHVKAHGNWEGRTILHRNHPQGGGDDAELDAAKADLLAERDTRVRPGRDDKVLADWNGMMIAALAEAAMTFDRPDWLAAAKRAYDVVRTAMGKPDFRLFHSLCRDKAAHPGVVDDYAHMARAALTLFQATGDTAFTAQAGRWLDAAHDHHWDKEGGGYFVSALDTTDIILRTKPCFDSAVPSGNGAMAETLALMALASGEAKWRDRAEAVLAAFSAAIPDQLPNMTVMLDAFEILADPLEVTITGPVGDPASEALWRIAAQAPRQIHVLRREAGAAAAAIVCRASVCSAPLADPDQLRQALAAQ